MTMLEENQKALEYIKKEGEEILALVKSLKENAQPVPGLEDFLAVNRDTLNALANKFNVETPDQAPAPETDLPPDQPVEPT